MPLTPNQGFIFESGKVYAHSVGLSCCFRQWRAQHTHCSKLHGYALKVELTFRVNSSSGELDEYNWVQNFGGLKIVKAYLEDTFDHKTLVAMDDPQRELFYQMESFGILRMVVVDHVGCEAFAKMIYEAVDDLIPITVRLQEVKVSEHEGNWATYRRNS